jgi:hypothetical protein
VIFRTNGVPDGSARLALEGLRGFKRGWPARRHSPFVLHSPAVETGLARVRLMAQPRTARRGNRELEGSIVGGDSEDEG